jgi:hypothetical protein
MMCRWDKVQILCQNPAPGNDWILRETNRKFGKTFDLYDFLYAYWRINRPRL